ncbi:MAG: response regulator [Deltaproteobacteria bacterium]|nr:response regulator [Deltaproteobacteria bacterium]
MRESDRPAVLVIDEDRDIRRLMECVLADQEYEPVSCRTPEEGLNVLSQRHIDCVLLDIHFARTPECLGFLCALRALPRCAQVPVLATSVMTEQELARQVMDLGVRKLIPKPFYPREILSEIRAVFS